MCIWQVKKKIHRINVFCGVKKRFNVNNKTTHNKEMTTFQHNYRKFPGSCRLASTCFIIASMIFLDLTVCNLM